MHFIVIYHSREYDDAIYYDFVIDGAFHFKRLVSAAGFCYWNLIFSLSLSG